MPKDIFALASNNLDQLTDNFQKIRLSLSGAMLTEFDAYSEVVRTSARISINMRASGVAAFLSAGRHSNIYEYANEESAASHEDVNEILKRKLGKYYNLRITFDSYFEKSKQFRYGALNVGGAGAGRYGEFCLVLQAEYMEEKAVAHLRSDSLNSYFTGSLLNEKALAEDLAPNPWVHLLASIKHANEACRTLRSEWPRVTCNDDDYIESIFCSTVTPKKLHGLRLSESDYLRITDLIFEMAKGILSDGERLIAQGCADAFDLIKKAGLSVEIVNA